MDEDDSSLTPAHQGAHHRAATQTPPPPSTKDKGKERALDCCVICLEPISERAVAVPCNHCAFDFLCLVSWLQAHPKCPLCQSPGQALNPPPTLTPAPGKTTLSAVQYDWRAPHDYKTYFVPRETSPPPISSAPPHNQSYRNPFRPPPGQQRQQHRRHPPPAPRPIRNLTEHAALQRRKYVYAHGLFSAHVGANRVSQHRDVTPAVFARSPALHRRARAFLRRELRVFDFLAPDYAAPGAAAAAAEHGTPAARAMRRAQNAEFVLEYVLSILRTVDVKGASGKAQDMVAELLGREHAALFLHELHAWLRSPYAELADWDRHVQYAQALPALPAEQRS